MIAPPKPANEKERLQDLKQLKIVGSAPEDDFDNITQMASLFCDMPISLVSLVTDHKQWFKSNVGLDACETDRDVSFCSHAILNPHQITEVYDTRVDERFIDNPFTKGDQALIFYAGVPLLSHDGNALGTLCVLDYKPRKLTETQKKGLVSLGKQVENLFELKRKNLILEKAENLLKLKNEQLKKFAGIVSHDMKMPLANMIVTTDILRAKYNSLFDEQGQNYLTYLKHSSFTLSDYITSLLDYYESENIIIDNIEFFDLNELLEDILDLLNLDHDCEIQLPEKELTLYTNKSATYQILINLITNSLKYNDKEQPKLMISCNERDGHYHFEVKDNGMGISRDKQDEIFDLFKTASDRDNKGKKGHGIGLSTVRNLIHSLNGDIQVESEVGKGTNFSFSLQKPKIITK